MNQAQKNQVIIDEALKTPEGQAVTQVINAKVVMWFEADGGGDVVPWQEEMFKRLWLYWIDHDEKFPVISTGGLLFSDTNSKGAMGVMHKVMQHRFPGHPRFVEARLLFEDRSWTNNSTDDEFEELVEDWTEAIERVKNPAAIAFRDKRKPISEWLWEHIEADDIDWHRRSYNYWYRLLCKVDHTTRMPSKAHPRRTARSKGRTWPFFSSKLRWNEKLNQIPMPAGWHDSIPKSPAAWVKRVRYLVRATNDQIGAKRGQDPIEDYGEDIGGLLNAHMARMQREVNDPCMDNFRFADAGKSGDMKRYKRRVRRGCCGSYDTTVTIKGRKFWMGCNYGH